jgi:hypothetical protein
LKTLFFCLVKVKEEEIPWLTNSKAFVKTRETLEGIWTRKHPAYFYKELSACSKKRKFGNGSAKEEMERAIRELEKI